MSRYHFSRTFKRETGTRFIDFLTTVRLAEACSLLARTNQSITTISFAVGYRDLSHFERTFKKEFGHPPVGVPRARPQGPGGAAAASVGGRARRGIRGAAARGRVSADLSPAPRGSRRARATSRGVGVLLRDMISEDVASLETAPAVRTTSFDPAQLAARALRIGRATALGVLGDREAADDVAQEVAIVAVRRAGALRDPAALDAWLHRIAVRAALAEARRGRRRREAELSHHNGRPAAEAGAAVGTALELLADLPVRQRAALTLRYVHDLSDDAIAKALGCRRGTVRSLLSRGRDALRAAHHSSPGALR
jgi:RNA polymerase sigma factor (sigma-70 family)